MSNCRCVMIYMCRRCRVEPGAVRLHYVPGVGMGEEQLKACKSCLELERTKYAARRDRTLRAARRAHTGAPL
jgi:hypothetical protein